MANLTEEQKRQAILDAQYEKAVLDLDQAKEDNVQRTQQKAVKTRVNAERQKGFKIVRDGLEDRFRLCTHRQGGDLNQLEVDEGNPSALMVMKMPDDFTVIISCLICKGKRVSPHPYLMRTSPFPAGFHMANGVVLAEAETKQQVADRLAKYADDKAQFEDLLKQSRKKRTKVPDMDCGTVHILTRKDTGERVYPWRQSDVWPYAEPGYAKAKRETVAA